MMHMMCNIFLSFFFHVYLIFEMLTVGQRQRTRDSERVTLLRFLLVSEEMLAIKTFLSFPKRHSAFLLCFHAH